MPRRSHRAAAGTPRQAPGPKRLARTRTGPAQVSPRRARYLAATALPLSQFLDAHPRDAKARPLGDQERDAAAAQLGPGWAVLVALDLLVLREPDREVAAEVLGGQGVLLVRLEVALLADQVERLRLPVVGVLRRGADVEEHRRRAVDRELHVEREVPQVVVLLVEDAADALLAAALLRRA